MNGGEAVRTRLLDHRAAVRCYPVAVGGPEAADGRAPRAHVVVGSTVAEWALEAPEQGPARRWLLEMLLPFQVLVLDAGDGGALWAAALAPEGEAAWQLSGGAARGRAALAAVVAGCRRVGPQLRVTVRLTARLALVPADGRAVEDCREEDVEVVL